jgi:O-acetyl-ADP-ribose deacetylase (regulator of RNase III)
MMQTMRGNIVTMHTEAVVNTVNCEGYMGKGIALQFKKAYPDNYEAYKKACNVSTVQPGRMFVFETGTLVKPKYIINFPTKRHWRGSSRLDDIAAGLKALAREVRERGITSIAVPPLGCGLGGLDWKTVRPMIEKAFQELPDVQVYLFEPGETPDPKTMPVRTRRPQLTVGRALFIKLMQQYTELAYRLTLLELQKLAYFLQEAGQPSKLRYEAGSYGPYAHNLNKVLELLEGHYIRGYGDNQRPDVEIELMPDAAKEAERFLQDYPDCAPRLERVASLIEGFETPYGMELLSSIHWLALYNEPRATSHESAVKLLHEWSDRKRKMFVPAHVRVAWNRLNENGWLSRTGN